METQMNGFLWTILTRKKTKKLKNNLIKIIIERANTERTRESDSTKPQSQIRMFSGRKKTFLSFTLSLFYLFVAPVMQVLPVYAAEPAAALSVWDFMITELVGANCIITDSAVLSAYGSALGSLNAATATAAEIDAAIATAAVNCGVDLAPVFANTANAAASIGLESAAAATAGENLSATCAGFFAAGEGTAVIPAIAQTCLDVLGVAGIVAGIAYIDKMVVETVGDVIKFGQDVKGLSQLVNVPTAPAVDGHPGDCFSSIYNSRGNLTGCYLGSPVGYYQNGTIYQVMFMNRNSYSIKPQVYNNGSWRTNPVLSSYASSAVVAVSTSSRLSGMLKFGSVTDINNYLNSFRNGEKHAPLTSTPSIASSNGYQVYDPTYTPENNPNEEIIIPGFPELKPLPDYANGYGLSPIPSADFLNLVNQILEVPGNPYYLEDQEQNNLDISTLVDPFIDPYIVPIGDPSPNPDPQPTGTPDPEPTGSPDPQPTGSPNPNPNPKPNTQPFPNPETVPQPTPVVNPTPDSEIAPAPVPYPDPETPTEQDKTDTDTKITPIDLRDKFPFCIPFDMLKIMKLFQGGREAPCFTWEIPFGAAGSGSVTVDLSAWDSAAALLRTLELILFIMLLAVGTRNLIGGSS